MKKTFKDFLTSRDQLTKQCLTDPIMKITYNVKKYSKLNCESNTYSFKPKDKIIVEWTFDKTGNVIGISSMTKNGESIECDKSIVMLKKWLSINTILTTDNWFI